MATEKRLISFEDCPCDGCKAKPCGHPARCVKFALWLNKTVDAVEVVRCKDCKSAHVNEKHPNKPLICGLTRMCGSVDPEWYCWQGKRRTNEKVD